MDLGPRYRFLREVGEGGMGRVFLARDVYLAKDVALKLLKRRPDPAALEQFHREFSLLAQIDHPRIARAHDFGWLGKLPYFTSEFVPGRALSGIAGIGSLPEILAILREIAGAVAFLHRSEVLHLDVKPSNVILRDEEAGGGAVLIDFGLVRRGLGGSPGTEVRGSLRYMAPEFFRSGPIGPWTDVYALGVTFYQLLSGRPPRWASSPARAEDLVSTGWDPTPEPPVGRDWEVPADLASIVLKCLSLDAEFRFPSATELAESLSRLDGRPAAPERRAATPSPTAGRDAELNRIDSFLERLASGGARPRTLLITGPSGMGQSHLFREIKARAQKRGLAFHHAEGHPGRPARPGMLLETLGLHHAAAGPAGRKSAARWRSFLARLRQPRAAAGHQTFDAERRARRAQEAALVLAAVREPLLLAVDGLQHWDEVSQELFIDLVRELSGNAPGGGDRLSECPPPVGAVIGYREEGPGADLLRELTAHLLEAGRAETLTLGPLALEEAWRLYLSRREAPPGAAAPPWSALRLHQETGGAPSRIVALAAGPSGDPQPPPGDVRERPAGPGTLRVQAADALGVLFLLRRPAAAREVAALAGIPAARAGRVLDELRAASLAASAAGETAGSGLWSAAPGAAEIVGRRTAASLRSLHLRIARALSRAATGPEDPRALEAVLHFSAAGRHRQAAREGLPAARYLMSTYQNRRALEVLRAIHRHLPPRQERQTALAMADLHARTGDLDEGIRILRERHLEARRLHAPTAQIVLRLAVLHGRKGDLRRADSLFAEGFRRAEAGPAGRADGLSREERLRFLNEYAALKTFLGDPAASRLCEEGLRLARGSRSLPVRDAALNLYATRANIALRKFDFGTARADFERALEMAEAIGSLGNQAVVLNNLGKLHSQCDRYRDAIAAFREAERTCLRIDEGPSLAAIYSNLCVLEAKVGDGAAVEDTLARAATLPAGALGLRERFFLAHAQGLARLYQGRYREARAHLEAALPLGNSLGDRHVCEFDEVYRAEALLFEGRYGEARAELERLADGKLPVRIRKMALARRALLEAWAGQDQRARTAEAAYCAEADAPPVPFLDAWDALFLGWALALGGRGEEAAGRLESAASFFRRHGLRPAAELAGLVEIEARWISGRNGAGGDGAGFDAAAAPAVHRFAAALRPLLAARLLMDRRLAPPERERVAGLLAEAGAALVGNPLPELSARVEIVRDRLAGGDGGAGRRLKEELARELPPPEREAYLEAPRWKAWEAVAAALPARKSARVRSRARVAPSGDPGTRTRDLPDRPPPARAELVARSPGMKRILAALDRLRGSDLPVLIQGETGSGKEMVARILHRESRRSAGPFLVLDCAAIPESLFEVELLGARAGAYTDQTRDRRGILSLAEGGTVLVDRIESLPPEVQGKLARILSEKTIRPLGAEETLAVDVRFLFSSSLRLQEEVEAGRFRRDLFHRIQVMVLEVPPLRERPDDLAELALAFLREGAGPPPAVSEAAWERLRSHSWPGNVRELRNLLVRCRLESSRRIGAAEVDRALGRQVAPEVFPPSLLAASPLATLQARLEREYLRYHFRRLGGDTRALCALLGLNRRQLFNRLKRLGISLREERRRLDQG